MKLHDYQEYAVKFIEEHKTEALFLDMGLGWQNHNNPYSYQ